MKIGVVGYGNMGEAFAKALSSKVEVLVYDISFDKREKALSDGFGVAQSMDFLLSESDWLLLAVKPKDAPQVLHSLRDKLHHRLIVSLVAALTTEKIREYSGAELIVRLMPNINALVGMSTIAYAFGGECREELKKQFLNIFSSCGSLYEIPESMFDAFTALAGSGPAFTFKFIHALALAGVMEGFSYDVARGLILDMVAGSCELLKKMGGNPDEWVIRVASPGGTTIEGIKVLEERGFSGILMECIRKTSEKSRKLL